MKKTARTIYYIIIALIVIPALVMVMSILPIPGNVEVLTVLSGSMEPAIRTGSVVIVKPSDAYKVGDVITFESSATDGIPITHRIVEEQALQGEMVYITQGDANNSADNAEVRESDVRGKVLFSVPFAGYAVDFARQPLGFILFVIVPALIIVFMEFQNIWDEMMKLQKKKEPQTEL